MSTIEFKRCPVVGGKAYASMDEFKRDAIEQMFRSVDEAENRNDDSPWSVDEIANEIVEHADEIIEILTLNTRSRPQMRKERKARKPRKDATLPLEPKDNT